MQCQVLNLYSALRNASNALSVQVHSETDARWMWYHFVPNVNITAQTNLPDVNAVISNRRLDLAVRACQTTFIWTSRSRRNDQRTTKTQVEKPGRPRHTWVTQITQDCLTHLTLNSIPKRNFCSSVSNNSLKFTTAHSIPLIQFGTLVSSSIVISRSLTKSLSKSCHYHIRELRCIRPYLDCQYHSHIYCSL